MSIEYPTDPRQALEASLTALLLGELPPDQAQFLREALVRDPELARIHQRLKQTIELIREAQGQSIASSRLVNSASEASAAPALRLSDGKRGQLLQHFKTVPLPTGNGRSRTGWSIVTRLATEPIGSRWLAVAAALVVCLLAAAMLLPALSKAKSKGSPSLAMQSTRLATRPLVMEQRISPRVSESAPRRRGGDAATDQSIKSIPRMAMVEPQNDAVGKVDVVSSAISSPALASPQANIVLPQPSAAEGGYGTVAMQTHFTNGAVVFYNEQAKDRGQVQERLRDIGGVAARADDKSPSEPLAGIPLVLPESPPVALSLPVEGFIPRANYAGGGTGGGGTGGGLPPPLTAQVPPPPAEPALGAQKKNGTSSAQWADFDDDSIQARVPLQKTEAAGPAGVAPATPPAATRAPLAAFRRRYGVAQSESAKEAAAEKQRVELAEGKRAGATDSFGDYYLYSKSKAELTAGVDPITGLPATASGIDPNTGLPVTTAATELNRAVAPPATRESSLAGGFAVETEQVGKEKGQDGLPMRAGNVALAESSVQQFSRKRLQEGLRNSGDAGVTTLATNAPQLARGDADFKLGWDNRGLMESESRRSSDKKPQVAILGDMPTLGKLFRAAQPEEFAGRPMAPAAPGQEVAGGRLSIVLPSSGDTVEKYASRREKDVALHFDSSSDRVSNAENVPVQSAAKPESATPTPLAEIPAKGLDKLTRKAAEVEQGKSAAAADLPANRGKPAMAPPVPQPEISSTENAFSTFSLNVSDVSFKLAGASLEKGVLPDPASIRSEEFINAFDYRDPEPGADAPIGFAWERARYPFAQNRDLLRFSVKTAAQGRQAGRPINVVLLLDNSGSMERADRVQILRQALRVLATQLQAQDKLSVITFSRVPHLRVDGISGSEAGKVADEVAGLTPQGGTNLEEAMKLAYKTAARHYVIGGINRVVVLTDGAANLGDVNPEALKKSVEDHRRQGIALDCFGIGWEGYNDDLLEVLSRNGDGRYGFLNTPEEAATEFVGQLAGALRVAASDVKVQVEFNPSRVTSYRQIGYAKHQLTKEQFRDNTVDAAELGAAESGNALYVIEVNPQGDGPLAIVRVRYKEPGTADYHEHEWPVPYNGNAPALEQASPAMRLAASASAFSEWLATSPFAATVNPEALLGLVRGLPQVYGADTRPAKLEAMIRQANSLAGK